jgi:hypothetical protein
VQGNIEGLQRDPLPDVADRLPGCRKRLLIRPIALAVGGFVRGRAAGVGCMTAQIYQDRHCP